MAGLLVGAAVTRVLVYWCCSTPYEDSLISMRYARNIASGLGFVYNPGEHVLGTSTPLWTLINALYIRLFGSSTLFAFGFWLSLLLDLCSLVMIRVVLVRAGFGLPAATAAILPAALFSPFVFSASSDMEISLFSALLAGSILAFQRRSMIASALSAGFLALCRPEGFLWLGLLLLILAWERRGLPLQEGLVASAVVGPWLVGAELYFGHVIPHSAVAKAPWTYMTLPRVLRMGIHWLPRTLLGLVYIEPGLGLMRSLRGKWLVGGLAVLPILLFLAGLGAALRRRGTREMALLFAVLVCFYTFCAPTVLFPWYGVPVSMLFYPILMLGAWRLYSNLAHAQRWKSRLEVAIGSAACCVLALALLVGLDRMSQRLRLANQDTEHTNKAMGVFFSSSTPKDARIMLEPIGYVGFYSDRYILDLAGLVSPAITRLRQQSPNDWYLRAILSFSPDYLVLRDFEIRDNAALGSKQKLFRSDLERVRFFAQYRKIREYRSSGLNGSESFLVFQKVDAHSTRQPNGP